MVFWTFNGGAFCGGLGFVCRGMILGITAGIPGGRGVVFACPRGSKCMPCSGVFGGGTHCGTVLGLCTCIHCCRLRCCPSCACRKSAQMYVTIWMDLPGADSYGILTMWNDCYGSAMHGCVITCMEIVRSLAWMCADSYGSAVALKEPDICMNRFHNLGVHLPR